jgi:hypothetical protein
MNPTPTMERYFYLVSHMAGKTTSIKYSRSSMSPKEMRLPRRQLHMESSKDDAGFRMPDTRYWIQENNLGFEEECL